MTSRLKRIIRTLRIFLILLAFIAAPTMVMAQEQAAGVPEPKQMQPQPTTPAVAERAPGSGEEQSVTYTIKQGDTLWDIAGATYRDPFLWPLLWQANPSITNPDLIYPDTTIAVPSLAPVERAIQAIEAAAPPVQEKAAPAPKAPEPAPVAAAVPQQEEPVMVPSFFRQRNVESTVPEPEEPASARKILGPEEGPVPIVDKYAMISAGFVSDEDSDDRVIGSLDDAEVGIHGQNIHGYGQDVYISVTSRNDVKVGDLFIVYEPVHIVKHPDTGKRFGKLYKVNGILKVIAAYENNVYTARISLSFDAVMKGNMLAPYQEPALIYPVKVRQVKNISGTVLDVTDRKDLNSQGQVVYLDKGTADGVTPGDWFTVYAWKTNESGVPQYLGDAQVFIVKQRTSTAIIRTNVNEVTIGDRVEYKN
jgi:nucleoid-associated protein YgaU